MKVNKVPKHISHFVKLDAKNILNENIVSTLFYSMCVCDTNTFCWRPFQMVGELEKKYSIAYKTDYYNKIFLPLTVHMNLNH